MIDFILYPNDCAVYLSENDIQAVFDIETSVGLLWMQSVRDYFRYMWT